MPCLYYVQRLEFQLSQKKKIQATAKCHTNNFYMWNSINLL